MLLSEAKDILNKNGYEVVEAYDAVTDRNRIKDRKQKVYSYYHRIMNRLKNSLAEEGIRSSVSDLKNVLKIGKYKITLYKITEAFDDVKEIDNNYIGAESGEDASYSLMENTVILRIFNAGELLDEKEFEVRDTPSMVEWILDIIEG